ncbi:phosphatidylserine decarboxylase [Marinifilum sp. D714]|uniref:phosphatidylserine decarboxylase n=1 Tax=Marinifilum sp. D714 TaxID=2937523 RepID=UPI0027BCD0C6|nr:phosphatidylserine decarboxylase [Marinifilum sp. D714]MDQ2180231.1 phosphatidylserine decarboxylase [Marinifilum sp. D714]
MEYIEYIERESGEVKKEVVPGKGMLKWLYGSFFGKASLHVLVKRKVVSAVGGRFMNSRLSKGQIKRFVKKNGIDLSIYHETDSKSYKHFNDFFYRKIQDKKRPIGDGIVSPADGKILAFPSLKDVDSFFIKGSEFSVNSFLGNSQLAEKYVDGAMAIVRLAPADYHRYHFPAGGIITESKKIKGKYFSVSPLALKKSLEIFCQNQRAYSILKTEEYGDILISEVGATMVGSIIQTYKKDTFVEKGSEKGYFAFGGSTVVLFFEKDKVVFDKDIVENTRHGYETSIKMGENIARKHQ